MTEIRGLTYPLKITNGRLSLSEDLDLVSQSIMSVLETRPFERVLRANYGFDPGIFDTLEPNAINARIWQAVTDAVPEITDLQVEGSLAGADDGAYFVTLRYSINNVPQPPQTLTLNF